MIRADLAIILLTIKNQQYHYSIALKFSTVCAVDTNGGVCYDHLNKLPE